MKQKTYRMMTLAMSGFIYLTTTARPVNDSTSVDSTKWFNKTHQLGEVTVKSSLPKIRTNADGMKITITGSELEKVGNTEDLLRRLPSIKKVDDGVEIFGRGNAEIYVNGRKLYDMKELKEIPSDQIVNVEIITNPGARYHATTKAVIKIKTRRPQGEGWGFRDELKGYYLKGLSVRNQLDVNYRKGSLDLGGWVTGEKSNMRQIAHQEIHTYQQGKLLRQFIDKNKQKIRGKQFDLGLKFNYMFNENQSIGARYDFSRRPDRKCDMYFPSVFTFDGKLLQESLSDLYTNEPTYKHNFNAYYSGKIGQWQVDANVDGVWTDSKTTTDTYETIKLPGLADTKEYVHIRAFTKNRIMASKLVLEHPLFGGKISFGTEYNDTRRTEQTVNPKASDGDSKVNEKIWAGFAEYSRVFFDKLTMNAGLRYENVKTDFYEKGNFDMDRDYDDWFPSLGLAMPIGKVQLGAHYGIDIDRPDFRNLSDNVYYINSYSYQTGNSKLKPTYTHNLSLNASWKWLWAEASYSKIVDDIQIASTSYTKDNELITLLRPENLANFHRYSFQVFASPTLFNIWHPTWGFAVVGQDYETTIADGSKKKMNSPMYNGIWNNLVILKSGWRLGLDFLYQSSGDYSTYHLHKPGVSINASIQKSFFKDKLDMKLSAIDLTGVRSQPVTVYSNRDVYVKNDNYTYADLTITYKFNVAADKYKGRGAGDQVKSRIK